MIVQRYQRIVILIKALFQITYLIEHLQEKFKFVHNDLHFFIYDFDASRIEIDNNIIIGNTY
jgi:hypothetical protein